MKRIFLITALFALGIFGTANAQLQEGTFMLGADIGSGIVGIGSNGLFGFNFGLNEGAGYSLGISPKVGYFTSDNFMLGAIANLGFTKSAETTGGQSTKTTVYGIQALSRYYVSPGEAGIENFTNSGRFFLEANAGIAGINIKDGNTTNGFAFGVGPGYSYFISNTVALETSLKYNGLVGGGNTTYQNSLGLNLGVQVFLSKGTRNDIENREDN